MAPKARLSNGGGDVELGDQRNQCVAGPDSDPGTSRRAGYASIVEVLETWA